MRGVKEKVASQARSRHEGQHAAVDALRRYGSWLLGAFVLLPLPLALLFSVCAVAAYLLAQAMTRRSRV